MGVKFVIIGSQRTGSTLLRMKLNSLLAVRCHGEVFLGKYNALDGFNQFLIKNRFYHFYFKLLTHKLGKYIFPSIFFKNKVDKYLNFLFYDKTCSDAFQSFSESEKYLTNSNYDFQEAVGFKLMYDQLKILPYIEQYLIENNFIIIHLIRENKIEQYLSKIRMKNSKIAHVSNNNSLDFKSISIDKSKFHSFYLNEKKNEELIDFKFRDLTTIKLSYENIFMKFDDVLSELGVSDKNSIEKENLLKKISNKSLKDQINNYNELLDFCKFNNIL